MVKFLLEYLYYITLIIVVLSAGISLKKEKKILFFVSLSLMVLISAIRFGQGIDYFSYEYIYDNQLVDSFGTMLDHQVRFEVGFRVLIFIFKRLGFSAHFFIAFCSIFTLACFALWIYKSSPYPTFSLALFYGMFYLIWVLSALRQGIVMGVATYFLFSKERKLNTLQELILILILSTIHYSALIYVLFILVRNINLDYKLLMGMFILSLIITFIPIPLILSHFTFIPGVSKLIGGAVNSPGIFDFSGMVRIGFSFYLLFILWKYDWNDFSKRLIQLAISGMILYFCFKMNELWAGRIGVYTFILMPVIISLHVEKINAQKFYKIGMVLTSLIFSMMYFQKDATSTQVLTGYIEQNKFLKLIVNDNITYEDYFNYENEYSLYTYLSSKMKFDREEFIENHEIEYEQFDQDVAVVAVHSPITNNYGIINERGYWITDQNYGIRPVARNRVVQRYISGGLNSFEYEDRYGLGLSEDEVLKDVNHSLEKVQENNHHIPETYDISLEDIQDELLKVFPSVTPISSVTGMKFEKPFEYNIVQVKYFNYVFFLYFDSDLTLIRDNAYLDLRRYNENGFLFAKGLSGMEVINKEGEIIMYE